MLRPTFLLRRIGSAWLLVSCLMATVFVTSALVSALVSFYETALPATVSTDLVKSGRLAVIVTGEAGESAARQAAQVSGKLTAALAPVPARFYRADWSDELSLPGAHSRGQQPAVQAAAMTGITASAVLTSGSWPGQPAAGSQIAAALPAGVAARLKAGVGSVLRLRDLTTSKPVTLKVTGLYRPRDPAAAYWKLDPIGPSGYRSVGGFASYGPAVVSPAAFAAAGGGPKLAVGQSTYLALPDPQRLARENLTLIASKINATAGQLERAGNLNVSTSLPQTLTNTAAGLDAARSLLIISGLQLLVLAGAALALASRLLASHRDEESALLAARGAARWQLARPSLSEAAISVVLASAAGVLAGSKLAGRLLSTLTGRPQAAAYTGQVWLAGAVLALACLGIVLWPALRPPGIAAVRIRRGRQAAVASAAAAGADIALIALALLSVRELRSYSAAAHATGGSGVDPVIVIAPALALAGLAIIPLRLLPVAARGLERVTARGRRLGSAMANWEISRRPLRQSGPALLVILAVGTSTLALAQYQSWRESVRQQARYSVGADVRAVLPAPETLSGSGQITRLSGVTSAVPASNVGLIGGAQLLVLGLPQASRTIRLRPDLSAEPEAALFRSISAGARAGLALPGKPDRLAIRASMAGSTGGSLGPVSATFIIEDRYGASYPVTTGSMPADGHEHLLVARLAASPSGPAYPLRIIGVSLNYSLPEYPASSAAKAADILGRARIGAISVSPAASGPFGPASGTGASLAGWNTNLQAGGLANVESMTGQTGTSPVLTSIKRDGPAALVQFRTGYAPPFPPFISKAELRALKSVAGGPIPAELKLDIPAPPALPVIATASYASVTTSVGAPFQVTIAGTSVSCTVVATVTDFPTGASLVTSQSAVSQYLASVGEGGTLPPASWWLSTRDGSVPSGLPAGTAVLDADQQASDLQRDALSAAPVQAALAVAGAAALLAALGFCVSVAASARARRSQRALLAALGVPAGAQARLFCLEEFLISAPAALIGLAVGAGLARLLIPSITLTATAGVPVPPVQVIFPVLWVAAVALLAPAIPVLAAMISALRQPDPAAELRAAEAAG